MKSFYDIIVIGAGPAGMAAALSAAEKAPQRAVGSVPIDRCLFTATGLPAYSPLGRRRPLST